MLSILSSAGNYSKDAKGVLSADVLDVLWDDVAWIPT